MITKINNNKITINSPNNITNNITMTISKRRKTINKRDLTK